MIISGAIQATCLDYGHDAGEVCSIMRVLIQQKQRRKIVDQLIEEAPATALTLRSPRKLHRIADLSSTKRGKLSTGFIQVKLTS